MKMWSSQLWLQFKQLHIWSGKEFQAFNEPIAFCVSAAVPYQLSYDHIFISCIFPLLTVPSLVTEQFAFLKYFLDELPKEACVRAILTNQKSFKLIVNKTLGKCCYTEVLCRKESMVTQFWLYNFNPQTSS